MSQSSEGEAKLAVIRGGIVAVAGAIGVNLLLGVADFCKFPKNRAVCFALPLNVLAFVAAGVLASWAGIGLATWYERSRPKKVTMTPGCPEPSGLWSTRRMIPQGGLTSGPRW